MKIFEILSDWKKANQQVAVEVSSRVADGSDDRTDENEAKKMMRLQDERKKLSRREGVSLNRRAKRWRICVIT